MKIKTIALTNFRNYRKQIVTLGPGLNFIIGSNGEGKTNFLEAIYVLALAKSYKAPDKDLVLIGSNTSRIAATMEANHRNVDLAVAFSDEGKTASHNRQAAQKLSDYIGVMNVVLFTPEDMELIKGGPAERRYFIDVVLGQTDKEYLSSLTNYKHILKQRNELLKQIQEKKSADLMLLDVLTEQLSENGEKIIAKRHAFLQELSSISGKMYEYLTTKNETLTIGYHPSVEVNLLQELQNKKTNDLYLGTTNTGPHRDDIDWFLGEQSAKNYASQGEQRLIILSVDMALCDYIARVKGDRPVFLLDDVFSELDAQKQNKLIRFLIETGNQAIITSTSLVEIDDAFKKQAHIYHVLKGSIREEIHHGQS
jgi:DNA replication and repair protein RecF